jgi:DNA-directed RNA polymerase subunit beta'
LKKNEEIVESLGERILGRVALQDVINPLTNEVLFNLDNKSQRLYESDASLSIESGSSFSVCEALKGICAKCYGRNLATGK